jgi:hypothetical protein
LAISARRIGQAADLISKSRWICQHGSSPGTGLREQFKVRFEAILLQAWRLGDRIMEEAPDARVLGPG